MKNILLITLSILSFQLLGQNVLAKAELIAENVNEVRVDGSFVDVYVTKGDQVTFKGNLRRRN